MPGQVLHPRSQVKPGGPRPYRGAQDQEVGVELLDRVQEAGLGIQGAANLGIGDVAQSETDALEFCGELSLTGDLRPVRGDVVIPKSRHASEHTGKRLIDTRCS